MDKAEQKLLGFIDEKKLIDKNDRVLVALSGGPDSVFLLRTIVKFKRRLGISIGAVHVNHMIRGKSADADAEFCMNLCLNLGVDFFLFNKRVRSAAQKRRISVEEAGHIIRYSIFRRTAEKNGYSKIATAHNRDDNTETVLLNLIKGTGLAGMAGIPVKRGKIIRPALNISKKEILDYLNRRGCEYRTDHTNFSNDYERNFLRNEIIPLIKSRLNPDLDGAVFNSSEIFREFSKAVEDRIAVYASRASDYSGGVLSLKIDEISNIEPELVSHFLKAALEKNFGRPASFADVKNLKVLTEKETGTKINLSGGLTAIKDRAEISVYLKNEEPEQPVIKIGRGQSIYLGDSKLTVKQAAKLPERYSGTRQTEYISADGIRGGFTVRRWRAGDKFRPLGLKGEKKVSDFLTEQKIPARKKSGQMVLTYKDTIVWVLGLRLDDRFKVTNNTKRIFELCLK